MMGLPSVVAVSQNFETQQSFAIGNFQFYCLFLKGYLWWDQALNCASFLEFSKVLARDCISY